MAFRVGQKVVCVASSDEYEHHPEDPDLGDVATIANIYVDNDGIECVELIEYPAPEDDEYCPGYFASIFRPVVSTDTGMAILEQIRRDVTNKELRPICHDEQV